MILHDVLSWTQEDFERDDLEEHILDDTSHTVRFVLHDKTIEFNGGTSSKGVRLIRGLFFKYFEAPEDIEYFTKQIDSDII